jgi:hypothetical protein
MISNEIILKKKEIMNENKILKNRIFESAGVLHGYLRNEANGIGGTTWGERQLFIRSAEVLKFLINVIDVANEDVDKPLIVFNDSINEVEWRDSDYGKVFHVPNSHIISLIFRSEKTMRNLGITEDSLTGFLLPDQPHRNLCLNSDVLESVCKAKFIYKDNVCIKVDSYEKFCSFINNSLLIMISNYSNNMNEEFVRNIIRYDDDSISENKNIKDNLRSILVYLTVMDKRFDSGIMIGNHKDTIDFYSSFLANESNEELDMAVSLSDIKNIILSMLNTITISKVDLKEAIELGVEVTDEQILKEDDFD